MNNFWRLLFLLAVTSAATTASASASVWQDVSSPGNRRNAAISLEEKIDSSVDNGAQFSWDNPAFGNSWREFQSSESTGFNRPESAFALISAGLPKDIMLKAQENFVLSGGPGETVTLNLHNFMLRDRATLTLEGTATTSFVINVTNKFVLSGSARIVLSGGVQLENVFYNILGSGTTVLLKKNAILYGILTATGRTALLRGHSIVYGKVIANEVELRDAAQIIPPPITSP